MQKNLSHAHIIVGPDSGQRQQTVTELAAALLCTEPEAPCRRCRNCRKVFAGIHPDVIFIRRLSDKGKLAQNITVDQIRDMTRDAAVAPNEAERKVYVLPEADRMNTPAQNALLKTLEEPPGRAAFLLCTAAADALLETVRSRCTRVDTDERSDAVPPLSELAAAYLETAAGGRLEEITRFCLLRAKLSREETEALLTELAAALCDILCARRPNPGLTQPRLLALSALITRAQDYLRHNVSPKQIFGVLAAETLR